MTVSEAASDLYDHFRIDQYSNGHPWIASIGVAQIGPYNDTDRIHLMLVRKPKHHEGTVPAEWCGYPVVSRVTGRMRLC